MDRIEKEARKLIAFRLEFLHGYRCLMTPAERKEENKLIDQFGKILAGERRGQQRMFDMSRDVVEKSVKRIG